MDLLYYLSDDPPKVLEAAADVTPEVLNLAYDCAEATYGLNQDFRIDWDRAYGMLETLYGFSMETWDSPADRKIRREVNKRRRNEGLDTRSVED